MELEDDGDDESDEAEADDDFSDLGLELEDDDKSDETEAADDFAELALELGDDDDDLADLGLELEDDGDDEPDETGADDDFADLALELEDEDEDEDSDDDLASETEADESEDDFEEFGLELESKDDEDDFGELALDFDDKNDDGTDFEETVGLNQTDLDYSQIDETIDKAFTPEVGELSAKEEPELEFEYEADEPETASQPEPQVSEEIAETDAISENTIEEDPVIADIQSKLAMQKKILLPILLLLIIIFGGFAYFFYTDQPIPFVGSLFGSGTTSTDEDDPGNHRASTVEDRGYYVTQSDGTLLFVIEGKVRNDYAQPRSYFRVKGKLYANNKKVLQEQEVSAGNILTKSELASLSLQEIANKLNNIKGSVKQNTNIKTSQKVPFMVIFSNLANPDALEEYSVEVTSSMPAK